MNIKFLKFLNNQDKEITSNGSYTADKGYTGLGTVIVNVPVKDSSGDVKLFATEEEMQSDTTSKEGDLAIVYRNEIQNAKADSQFQIATFPETVVLPSEMSSSCELRFAAVNSSQTFDCFGMFDSSNFMLDCYMANGMFQVNYTSSDGITYTRVEFAGSGVTIDENNVDFGIKIKCYDENYWNDNIGYFIQIARQYFGGLYQYNKDMYIIAPSQLTLQNTNELLPDVISYGKNGVIEGDGSIIMPDNTFADISAMLYYNIQNQYDNMEPRILTDDDKEIDKNIYFIPIRSDGTILIDTSQLTSTSNLFYSCKNLIVVPELNTSNVDDTSLMFSQCSNLRIVQQFDTSNAKDMHNTFAVCKSLLSIPQLNTVNVTNMSYMCYSCKDLQTIPILNTANVENMKSIVEECLNLSDESLNNILVMCTNATKITSNKTLKYIGLTSAQATKCTTLSNYQSFVNAGWSTGY